MAVHSFYRSTLKRKISSARRISALSGRGIFRLRRNDPPVDIDVVDAALVNDAVLAAVADDVRVVSADCGVIFDHIVGQGGTSAYAEERGIDADLVVVFGAQKISGRLAQCCLIQDRCCLIGACINRGRIVGTVDALIDLKLLRKGTCGVFPCGRKRIVLFSPPLNAGRICRCGRGP